MPTSLLLTGALSWVGGGPGLPAEHCPALAPSPSSSRDDVIGKVCLTKDSLAAHPKGKEGAHSPLLLPSSRLPPLSPHCVPSPSLPPHSETLALGFFRPDAQGKPLLPSPEGPYTHLCALGPILPPGQTLSPRAKWLLMMGSEASASSARDPLKLHC